jgi:hypothetical protein
MGPVHEIRQKMAVPPHTRGTETLCPWQGRTNTRKDLTYLIRIWLFHSSKIAQVSTASTGRTPSKYAFFASILALRRADALARIRDRIVEKRPVRRRKPVRIVLEEAVGRERGLLCHQVVGEPILLCEVLPHVG